MILLGTADLHTRNKPEGTLSTYKALVHAVTLQALTSGAHYVVMAGDLIHEKHSVLVDLLNMLYDELEWAQSKGVVWILLLGNHDLPVKSVPRNTILRLFSRVAKVVIDPKIIRGNGYSLYFLPWRLPEQFKQAAQMLADKARTDPNPQRILYGHIGLSEGIMSPSNYYRVPQGVSVRDLHPELYTSVWLGDYHVHQQVAKNVYYFGAPIAHQHGDPHDQGVWLHTVGAGRFKAEQIPLTPPKTPWPRYITLQLDQEEVLELERQNWYRLQVSMAAKAYYDQMYGRLPNVQVEALTSTIKVDRTARRLAGIAEDDLESTLAIWLRNKNYAHPDYMALGMEYLTKAQAWRYEHGK